MPWWGAIEPSEAERKIAIQLAEAGQFEEAAKIAEGIADPRDQARAIRDVVLAHLERDGLDPAKRLADVNDLILKISRDPEIIAELIIGVAEWLAKQGEPSHALGTLVRAEGFAKLIGDKSQKGEAMWTIAGQYLTLGEIDRAKAMTDLIEDKFWKAAVQSDVSLALADAGDFFDAEQVAAAIDDAEIIERVEAFARLGEILAAAGQVDEARRVVDRIPHVGAQVRALAKVAALVAKADEAKANAVFAEADALATGIVDPEDQAEAFKTLAVQLAEAGWFDRADAVLARLIAKEASAYMISRGLEEIAQSLWDAGQKAAATQHLGKAELFTAMTEYPGGKSFHLLDISHIYIAFGQHDAAERVAAGIENAMHRAVALSDIGVALAEIGQPAEAARIAAVISEIEGAEGWRGEGPANIANALAAAGEVAAAEAVAEGIVETYWRANALAQVAIALAKRGQLSEAERIARRIEDPAWRAVALGAVAAGL